MKKSLLCLLALLLMLGLAACASKQPLEPVRPVEPPVAEPPDVEEPAEPASAAVLLEINIFHLGIRTPLATDEEHALALARQLADLMENAAATDSIEAPPESALNPEQVKKGQTALELIYDQDIELPLTVEGEPLTARRLLFSIPASSNEGGLLYAGYELYEEMPLGRLFDQALQNSIYDSATDQVERVTFAAAAAAVIIAGEEFAYYENENEDGAPEISGRLLNRMLYRAIAFHKNAYTGNINGLQSMSTATLYEAVLKVSSGAATSNDLGEETIANFNRYILADYFLPQAIVAPAPKGDGYQVVFRLHERVTLEIDFAVEEDMPLVSAVKLIIADSD